MKKITATIIFFFSLNFLLGNFYLPLKKTESFFIVPKYFYTEVKRKGECISIKNGKDKFFFLIDEFSLKKSPCKEAKEKKEDKNYRVIYRKGYISFYLKNKKKWKRYYGKVKPEFFSFSGKTLFVVNKSGAYNLFSNGGDLILWGKLPPEESIKNLLSIKKYHVILTDKNIHFLSEEDKKLAHSIQLNSGFKGFVLKESFLLIYGFEPDKLIYIHKFKPVVDLKMDFDKKTYTMGATAKLTIKGKNIKEGKIEIYINQPEETKPLLFYKNKFSPGIKLEIPFLNKGEYLIKLKFSGSTTENEKIELERFKKFFIKEEKEEDKKDDKTYSSTSYRDISNVFK